VEAGVSESVVVHQIKDTTKTGEEIDGQEKGNSTKRKVREICPYKFSRAISGEH